MCTANIKMLCKSYSTYDNFKRQFSFYIAMYKDAKYALDFVFLFTLVLSILLFGIGFFIDLHGAALDTLHKIDFAILGGYYAFFLHGIYTARNRLAYCKQHWIMLALLLLPLLPIARLAKIAEFEKAAAIGTNTIWHFFDELGLL